MSDGWYAALRGHGTSASTKEESSTPEKVTWLRLAQALALMLVLAGLYLGVSWWMDGHPSQAPLFQYVDASGRMTVEDVHAQSDDAFEPVPQMQSRGYSDAAHWFRLQRPASADGGRQVLLVQPSYRDDVRFYLPDPERPGRWIESQQGDRHPFAQRPRDELGFAVDARADVGQWMYVRVKSSGALSAQVRLLNEADAIDEDTLQVLGVGLYSGGVLLLAIGSVMVAVAKRDRFWALNALFQLMTAFAVFQYFGLGNRFQWPDRPEMANWVTNLVFTLHFFCGSVFYRIYIAQHHPPRWMLRMQDLMLLLLIVQLLLVLFGRTQAGLAINVVLVPLAAATAACLFVGVRSDDVIERHLLRFNMLGVFVYFVVFFLLHHGFIEATFMLLYPGLYLNVLSAVVLQLTLLRRSTLQARQQAQAFRELELNRQRVMSERREREEDGRFLSMLLHEARSPLTVIAMALGTLRRRLQSVDEQDEPLRQDLRRIDASINQMKGLFREVENINEIEHHQRHGVQGGGPPAGVQPQIDAQHLLSELVTDVRQQGDRLDVSGWTDLLDSGVLRGASLNCGLPLVTLMTRNLVSNALKYSPQDTPVTLQAEVGAGSEPGARQLRLSVVNQVGAAGFPDAGQLFRKYYRADGAHGISGSGLGLYWVRSMAHILDGDITYLTEGGNIRFSLVMPLHVA